MDGVTGVTLFVEFVELFEENSHLKTLLLFP